MHSEAPEYMIQVFDFRLLKHEPEYLKIVPATAEGLIHALLDCAILLCLYKFTISVIWSLLYCCRTLILLASSIFPSMCSSSSSVIIVFPLTCAWKGSKNHLESQCVCSNLFECALSFHSRYNWHLDCLSSLLWIVVV